MSEWKMERLSKLGDIVTGNTPKTNNMDYYSSNDICFYKPSDINQDVLNVLYNSENYVSETARNNIRIIPANSILVTCIGIIGKVALIKNEASFNQQINAIIPNKEIVDSKFLAYSILRISKQIKDIANAPVVPIINKTQFSKIEIPLPPIETQQKIAAILDKASGLIELRKAQLEKLDLMVKAKFIDMFGDPVTNPMGWEVTEFGSVIDVLTDYHANGGYETLADNVELLDSVDYALMIRTTDLEKNNFSDDVRYISKSAYEFLKKSQIFGGEIIINKIGSAGKVYYMPFLNRPVSLAMNQFLLRFNSKTISRYVYYYLETEYSKNNIAERVRGAVTKTITKDAVRSIPFIVPPLALQIQFAEFVEQVEKQKVLVQQGLEKLEQNYKSLMQQCFSGDSDIIR